MQIITLYCEMEEKGEVVIQERSDVFCASDEIASRLVRVPCIVVGDWNKST